MLTRLLGTKIGMTQMFDDNRRAVAVTVVDVAHWFVTQVKTKERDGYSSLQIGRLKKRYRSESFSSTWLTKKSRYFDHIREVRLDDTEQEAAFTLGQALSIRDFAFSDGDMVSVQGRSRGKGFQGVVKRWDFGGGPGGHGSMFHRAPGSIGHICSQGKVIKGKKLPGQTGGECVTVSGLKVMRLDVNNQTVWLRGPLPGKKHSLVALSKQGQ